MKVTILKVSETTMDQSGIKYFLLLVSSNYGLTVALLYPFCDKRKTITVVTDGAYKVD